MAQPLSYRKLGLFFLVWCSIWTALQTVALQYTFSFGWLLSFTDAAVTSLVIGIAGYDMMLVMRHYQPRQVVRVPMSIGLVVLCVLAIHHLVPWMIAVTPAYLLFLEKALIIRGLFVWLMIGLIGTLTWHWLKMREHQQVDERRAAIEEMAREAELSTLRQQLQPHFLFNSLNSISALIGSRPEEARKMIHQLSDFFRGTLRKDDLQLIPFSEELEHLTLYLEIEKVRFGHRLKTDIRVDDNTLSLKLPSLLLQPVVENAIKFGLYGTTGQTVISVGVKQENNLLTIHVQNPFDPASAPPLRGTGFGLNSIRRRLYLVYARNDLLTTSQKDNIFMTAIKIPQSV